MAQRQENLVRETTKSYRLYKEALENQAMTGLREKIPECVDFYEGRQWPKPTESTKNLPRPVVNIVKMICRAKKGAILSTPVRIQYKSYSPLVNVDRFNSFASSIFREIGQDDLDRRAIDDGIKKGSYFYHYYWDSEEISNESGETGALLCELIDPLNIFFSNPSELDEQKQRQCRQQEGHKIDDQHDLKPCKRQQRRGNGGRCDVHHGVGYLLQAARALIMLFGRQQRNGDLTCRLLHRVHQSVEGVDDIKMPDAQRICLQKQQYRQRAQRRQYGRERD